MLLIQIFHEWKKFLSHELIIIGDLFHSVNIIYIYIYQFK